MTLYIAINRLALHRIKVLGQYLSLSMKASSRMNKTCIVPTLVMLWMVLSGSASTRGEEVEETEDEREFDYMRGSEKGPDHWGELKKEWSACKHGKMQSPIDLSCARVKIIPRCQLLLTDYFSSNATIINRGHDIAIYWKGDAGSIDINGTEFFLKQCHWHSPSEHSINGRKYDLEMHMVHVSMEKKIFVSGAFYKIGHRPDRFLSQLEKEIKHLVNGEVEREIGEINPSGIQTRGNMYYRYLGSLTTPPCTEGVIWNIDRKIRTVSEAQVRLLREAVHDHAVRNSRPRQPRNQRDILYFRFKSRPKSKK